VALLPGIGDGMRRHMPCSWPTLRPTEQRRSRATAATSNPRGEEGGDAWLPPNPDRYWRHPIHRWRDVPRVSQPRGKARLTVVTLSAGLPARADPPER
jgi:hypothetical protein